MTPGRPGTATARTRSDPGSPAPIDVPILATSRLSLRGHRVEDLEPSAAMWGDPEVVRYIGGRPFTREEAWARLLRYVGHWALLGFGYWVVEEQASGRFVGEVGFADFHRAIAPTLDGPEAGWVLAPWAHGRGLASEAVQAILTWGDHHFTRARTVCMIDPANVASIRVAVKAGFVESFRTTYHGDPTIVFQR